MLTATDLEHLRRCVALATEALEHGDEPYGSVLVAADGRVLHEDRNRTSGGDATRHPELALAQWAAAHLAPAERPHATVYTSGEHCAMCSAAHAMVGLGRIVYASSTAQSLGWARERGDRPGPVLPLAVNDVAPGIPVDGPADELTPLMRALHERHSAGAAGRREPDA